MKLLKTLAIALIAFFAVTLTSCNNSFCSEQDKTKIIDAMYERFEAENGKDDVIWKNFTDASKKAYYEISIETEAYKDKTPEEIASLRKAKTEEIYKKEHPKSCLTLKDYEDPISGALIEGKSWGFAFGKNGGFIEGLLVYPIASLLIWLATSIGVPGIAQLFSIVLGTFIIRLIVVLLTFKQTVAAQKIQLLTPEMNALNAKYEGKNDEQSRNKKAMEMMALYKKYNINPLTSMIGPFLTLPIFISMYGAVQASTILREGVLGSGKHALLLGQTLSSGILNWNWIAIVLFILMIATQYLSMKVPTWIANKKTRKHGNPNVKNPQDSTQQIMTWVMLVMIVFVGWMLPIAMTIYWVSSSLFSILQSILMQNIKSTPKKNKKEENKSILDQIRG